MYAVHELWGHNKVAAPLAPARFECVAVPTTLSVDGVTRTAINLPECSVRAILGCQYKFRGNALSD